MEPAWVKVHGRKFALMFREVKIGNGAVRHDPCYVLTKTECLYIATKFIGEGPESPRQRLQHRLP